MLNANEARTINEMSDANITSCLDRLDPLIRQAAEKGLYEVTPGWTDTYFTITRGECLPKCPPHIELVIARLKSLGYNAKWGQLTGWAPKSHFGMMDDDLPEVASFGLYISWRV